MMYIRQVQILVQTQICTWLIVYTKRGAASSFCSTSRVLFSILFLQILFPAFRQIFCRAAEHIPYQLFHLFSGSSSFHLRILQECFHHQIKITQNSCFQNPLMVCHMGIHQLLDLLRKLSGIQRADGISLEYRIGLYNRTFRQIGNLMSGIGNIDIADLAGQSAECLDQLVGFNSISSSPAASLALFARRSCRSFFLQSTVVRPNFHLFTVSGSFR